MTRTSRRLLAAAAALLGALAVGSGALAAAPPDSTWVRLGSFATPTDRPLLALAVDPADPSVVLAGTASGEIYRSQDGGATWTRVASGVGRAVLVIAFDPFAGGAVLAGSGAQGSWRSDDGGRTWSHQPGLDGVSVRALGFARQAAVAGTDRGVYIDSGAGWQQSGLTQLSVDAIGVSAVNSPMAIYAGADQTQAQDGQVLFQSTDAGVTWSPVSAPSAAGTIVSALAAGPLPPGGDTRPVLLGTASGLYLTTDQKAWQALSGTASLPAGDYTSVAFSGSDPSAFYAASDGGGAGDKGGLWATSDGGQTFRSLAPPIPGVTALAVSPEQKPVLYIATYRPVDQAVMLWGFRDTMATPQPPAGGVPSPSPAAGPTPTPAASPGPGGLAGFLGQPEAPYLVLAGGAVLVLLLAAIAYVRRGRA